MFDSAFQSELEKNAFWGTLAVGAVTAVAKAGWKAAKGMGKLMKNNKGATISAAGTGLVLNDNLMGAPRQLRRAAPVQHLG